MLDDVLAPATRVAVDVLRPLAEQIDREARWPVEGIRALQSAGLGGLVVPVEFGGQGEGLLALARVCEILGAECPSTAISFGMHLVGSAVIAAKATRDQVARYLEPIVRGEHLTTLALSEPGTGSHFYLPESRLEPDDAGGFRVSGTKSFVTNGGFADSYVMSVAAPASGHVIGEFSCVVVARDAAGLEWGEPWSGWGMRGNSARTARLERVPVPQQDLIGEEGDQIWYLFRVVAPYFLTAMAGTYLGVAGAALEEARTHLLGRVHSHSGSTLASEPVLQHRFGTLWAQVQRTRALLHEAARLHDEGDPLGLPALCSAKAEVADSAERVVADCLTLVGGRGYARDSRLQRLYRDVRAAHIMAPTTDMLRTWTGRALLDLPLLGD